MEQVFIASVIAEGIEPKGNFPFGPNPAHETIYKNALASWLRMPADKDGLGTSNRFAQGFDPDPRHGEAQSVVQAASILIC